MASSSSALSSEDHADGHSSCIEMAAQLDMMCLPALVGVYVVLNLLIFAPLTWNFHVKKRAQAANQAEQRTRRQSMLPSELSATMRISGSWDVELFGEGVQLPARGAGEASDGAKLDGYRALKEEDELGA